MTVILAKGCTNVWGITAITGHFEICILGSSKIEPAKVFLSASDQHKVVMAVASQNLQI